MAGLDWRHKPRIEKPRRWRPIWYEDASLPIAIALLLALLFVVLLPALYRAAG